MSSTTAHRDDDHHHHHQHQRGTAPKPSGSGGSITSSSSAKAKSEAAPTTTTTPTTTTVQDLRVDDTAAREVSQMISRVVNLAQLVPALLHATQKFQLEQAAAAVAFERLSSAEREMSREQHFVEGLRRAFDFCFAAAKESLRKAHSIGVPRTVQQQAQEEEERLRTQKQQQQQQGVSPHSQRAGSDASIDGDDGAGSRSPNSLGDMSTSSQPQEGAKSLSPESAALLTQQHQYQHQQQQEHAGNAPAGMVCIGGGQDDGVAMFAKHKVISFEAAGAGGAGQMDRASSMPHLTSFNSCDDMAGIKEAATTAGVEAASAPAPPPLLDDSVVQLIAELNHYAVQVMLACPTISKRADIRTYLQQHALQIQPQQNDLLAGNIHTWNGASSNSGIGSAVMQYCRSALATMREVELAWFAEGFRTAHMNLLCNLVYESQAAGEALLATDGLLGIVIFHSRALDPENPGLQEWASFTLRSLAAGPVGERAQAAIAALRAPPSPASNSAGAAPARSSSAGSVASSTGSAQ